MGCAEEGLGAHVADTVSLQVQLLQGLRQVRGHKGQLIVAQIQHLTGTQTAVGSGPGPHPKSFQPSPPWPSASHAQPASSRSLFLNSCQIPSLHRDLLSPIFFYLILRGTGRCGLPRLIQQDTRM